MGFTTSRKASLFLSMNLLCYVLAAMATNVTTACNSCSGPSAPGLTPSRGGSSGGGRGSGGNSGGGSSGGRGSGGNSGGGSSGGRGSGGNSGGGSSGGSSGSGTNPGQQPRTCPRDALKLGVCANLLGGLVGVVIGNPPTTPCCTLLAGLVDLEAAVCLCTAIRANVLGINLNVQVALSLLLNVCGRTPPRGFICP